MWRDGARTLRSGFDVIVVYSRVPLKVQQFIFSVVFFDTTLNRNLQMWERRGEEERFIDLES